MRYFIWRRHNFIFSWIAALASFFALGCGGGGGGGTTAPPPILPDFTLNVTSSSVSVVQGSSQNVTFTITALNGFVGTVSVTISGMPTGTSATPSQFPVGPVSQQSVAFAANPTATPGSFTLTVNGQSGTTSHSIQINFVVTQSATPVPDFSISLQPPSITIPQGSSTFVTVTVPTIDNFEGQVNVTISGFPAGMSASPSDFSLTVPGGQQIVSIATTSSTPKATTNLTVTGQSGSITHNTLLPTTVTAAQVGNGPSLRTDYLVDDANWDSGFLSYDPQRWILYDPGTKRFFVSNTSLNRVEVYDATTETEVGQITVPGAFVGDETADNKTIYMGTQIGDIYVIDPVAMAVTSRIPEVVIGPAGFAANEVRVLANGNLALLGGQGGLPSVDGYSELAIWNPANNSFLLYGQAPGSFGTSNLICGGMGHIAEFNLSADRTKILLGSADSDDTLCSLDPATGNYLTAGTSEVSIGVKYIFVPPDGKEIIIPSQSIVTVYDASGLFQIDQFTVGDGTTYYTYFLSADGNTLFVCPYGLSGDQALAYNWRTHQLLGWVPSIQLYPDFVSWVTPLAMDETGLMLGVVSRGVAFLDGGAIQSSIGPTQVNGFVTPSVGPTQGGTVVQIDGLFTPGSVNGAYFGATPAASFAPNLPNNVSATTPAGSPGPVNVVVTTANDYLMIPQGFSFGPSIVESTVNASTAEGGTTGTVYGYGFGPTTPQATPANLQASVGGQTTTISDYESVAFAPAPYPFPAQSFNFTIPPGTAGTTANLKLTDSYGSVTAATPIQYLPALQQFNLSNSSLVQGIFDSRRNVYYFTDQNLNAIQVFSKVQGQWLTPINIPRQNSPVVDNLWGLSLSPDGGKLAVSDAGASLIYVFDPDTPTNIMTFSIPSQFSDDPARPGGLAITDSGVVYYITFYLETTGPWLLHKLNTNTGVITDYQTIQAVSLGYDAATRVLLSKDNTRVFLNSAGVVFTLDTATDATYFNPLIIAEDYELALSSNQTWMTATEYEMDTNLNPESSLVLNERETFNVTGVYGQKLSSDGNLLFSPLSNALDVFDGRMGTLRMRIGLPVALSGNFDALVSDGTDNVLIAITGSTGTGIAVMDLSSLPEPLTTAVELAAGNQLKPLDQEGFLALKSQIAANNRRAAAAALNAPHSTNAIHRVLNTPQFPRAKH
ncbi:MAG TPA: hypothetical protein VLV89_11300 [Candidatus Acidoferrum sp.]|nr:hypothetical protein [Candidatus Acidoferrum sp.]